MTKQPAQALRERMSQTNESHVTLQATDAREDGYLSSRG